MKIELQLIGIVAAALVAAFLVALVATPVVKSLAQRVGGGGCAQGRPPDA